MIGKDEAPTNSSNIGIEAIKGPQESKDVTTHPREEDIHLLEGSELTLNAPKENTQTSSPEINVLVMNPPETNVMTMNTIEESVTNSLP